MTERDQKILEESQRFRAALPRLLDQYPNRWVIFRDGAVIDSFDDEHEAYATAVARYGLHGGFVIAQVVEDTGPTPVSAGIHFGLFSSSQ